MKSKRIIALILSTTIVYSTININTVKADGVVIKELYANAYKATALAMEKKSQSFINEARLKIKLLPPNLKWAIGEFSKQLDKVQQPIFEKAYKAIVEAQNDPTQKNIDKAKQAIDPDMPTYFKGSYSVAIDKIQQGKMKVALDAYNKAIKSGLKEDLEKANELLDDIKGSINKNISNWVDTVKAKGNLKELSDGKVHDENYSIIAQTGVYGSENNSKITVINGNIFINNNEGKTITLKNIKIEGKLILNFGNGDIILENIQAKEVYVNNVGENSLHIKGESVIENIKVDDSDNNARISFEESTVVNKIEIASDVKLETDKLKADAVGIKNIEVNSLQTVNVNLRGKFDNIDLNTKATIEVQKDTEVKEVKINADAKVEGEGKVNKVNVETSAKVDLMTKNIEVVKVDSKATGTVIDISKETEVTTLNIEAKSSITGEGNIINANIGASGTVIDMQPEKVLITEGVKAEVAGEEKNESNTDVIESIPTENETPSIINPGVDNDWNGGNDYDDNVNQEEILLVENFKNDITPYLENGLPYYQTLENIRDVLIKYQDNFLGLEDFKSMGNSQKLVYASGFKHSFGTIKEMTKENIEKAINENYKVIETQLESLKIIGKDFGESVKFNMPVDNKEDIDVTDELIKFREPLKEGTILRIEKAYDYVSREENKDGMVESDCFYVKDGRIYVRPTYTKRTQSTIYLYLQLANGSSTSFNINVERVYDNSTTPTPNPGEDNNPGNDDSNNESDNEAPSEEEILLVENFKNDITPYLENGLPYYQTLENIRDVLIKYQDNFLGLEEFKSMGNSQKLVYASGFKYSFGTIKEMTKENIEKAVKGNYKVVEAQLESLKIVGKDFNEVVKFNMPSDIKVDTDVTDQLIKFREELKKGTVFEIKEAYDYVPFEESEEGKVISDCFYVKDGRIFMRPTYTKRAQSTIYLYLKLANGSSTSFNVNVKRIYN